LSKKKLINQLKEKNPKLNKPEINLILESFLKGIIEALKEGRAVELRQFGRFYFKKIKENFKARNPKTNELIYKPERVRLKFRAFSSLKKLINK
jgi:nucleoid DNA-binding protein